MSYNLYAEGDFDLLAVSRLVADFQQIGVFPIVDDPNVDAIGIAIPLSRAKSSIEELDTIVQHLLSAQARVYDLYSGNVIGSMEDLEPVYGMLVD